LKNIIYSIVAIAACVIFGKLISYYLGGLPSSLYGLICFTLLLHIKAISADKVQLSIEWIIKNMSVCFVPAGVGIIDHFELVKNHGIVIVFIIFITTFFLITVVGVLFEMKINKQKKSQSTKHSTSL
jgi:holin-like protein